MVDTETLLGLGIGLIFLGAFIVAFALFLLSFRKTEKGKISGGGAIIIGPVPIVFGTDRKALRTVLLLSIGLTLLLVILTILNYI